MFCNHCGTKLAQDAAFCNSCGAKVGDAPQTKSKAAAAPEAKYESLSVQTTPDYENIAIQIYEMFSWELVSSQTIDTKDSHLETIGNDLYSVTETTNYIKLVFRRNVNMPDYKRIKQFEKDYINSIIPNKPNGPRVALLIAGILLLLAMPPIGIAILVVYGVKCYKHKQAMLEYMEMRKESEALRAKCIKEMKEFGVDPIIDNNNPLL